MTLWGQIMYVDYSGLPGKECLKFIKDYSGDGVEMAIHLWHQGKESACSFWSLLGDRALTVCKVLCRRWSWKAFCQWLWGRNSTWYLFMSPRTKSSSGQYGTACKRVTKWPFVIDTGEETVHTHYSGLRMQTSSHWYSNTHKMVLKRSFFSETGESSTDSQLGFPNKGLWVLIVLFRRWFWNGHFSVTLGKGLHIHC